MRSTINTQSFIHRRKSQNSQNNNNYNDLQEIHLIRFNIQSFHIIVGRILNLTWYHNHVRLLILPKIYHLTNVASWKRMAFLQFHKVRHVAILKKLTKLSLNFRLILIQNCSKCSAIKMKFDTTEILNQEHTLFHTTPLIKHSKNTQNSSLTSSKQRG